MTVFADLADLNEDQRINTIGETARKTFDCVGFVVETQEKADRYEEKLKARFPDLHCIKRFEGPFGTVVVQVGKVSG